MSRNRQSNRPCVGCWIPAEGNAATTPTQPPLRNRNLLANF
jgi:hypothetical protein